MVGSSINIKGETMNLQPCELRFIAIALEHFALETGDWTAARNALFESAQRLYSTYLDRVGRPNWH